MTRQQGYMFGQDAAGGAAMRNGDAARRTLSRDRPPLPVIRAGAGECADHDRYLDMLDKSSGGRCVWRSLGAT
jgi:DNA polymerase-3 subunit epsilon